MEFSPLAALYEIPLLKKCLINDLTKEIALWKQNNLNVKEWCEKIVDAHWLHLSVNQTSNPTFYYLSHKSVDNMV